MASITKIDGKYRAFIRRKGLPSRSKTFSTKREAQSWVLETEFELEKYGKRFSTEPFKTAIERYRDEVSPTKRAGDKEILRLNAILGQSEGNQTDPICYVGLDEFTPAHIAQWRDRRLKQVKPSSVNREWNLLSNIFTYCVDKWEVMLVNPMSKAKRPKDPEPRNRRPSDSEKEQLFHVLNYTLYEPPISKMQLTGACFQFAIETAMRAKEICNLTWEDIELCIDGDEKKNIAKVSENSKGGRGREVPLSERAIKIIQSCKGLHPKFIFNITTSVLDSTFRKAKNKTLIEDLTFHDSRTEALTQLAKKMDVMTLAKVSGHRDIKILLNTYYHPKMKDVASSVF